MKMNHQSEETSDPSPSLAETIQARRKALKAEDLAAILALAPSTIYDMTRDGRIRSIRIGGAIRYDPKEIADWLRRNGG